MLILFLLTSHLKRLLTSALTQDSEFFMGSLDVDSLFTNIPLEETIDICTSTLFENMEKVEGLSKIEKGREFL